MLDPETTKQIAEIFNNIKDSELDDSDITPPPEIADRIKEHLAQTPTSVLCIMHTFICMELGDRGIEIREDE